MSSSQRERRQDIQHCLQDGKRCPRTPQSPASTPIDQKDFIQTHTRPLHRTWDRPGLDNSLQHLFCSDRPRPSEKKYSSPMPLWSITDNASRRRTRLSPRDLCLATSDPGEEPGCEPNSSMMNQTRKEQKNATYHHIAMVDFKGRRRHHHHHNRHEGSDMPQHRILSFSYWESVRETPTVNMLNALSILERNPSSPNIREESVRETPTLNRCFFLLTIVVLSPIKKACIPVKLFTGFMHCQY